MPRAYAELQTIRAQARAALQGHAGRRVHDRARAAVHAADAHGQAHRSRGDPRRVRSARRAGDRPARGRAARRPGHARPAPGAGVRAGGARARPARRACAGPGASRGTRGRGRDRRLQRRARRGPGPRRATGPARAHRDEPRGHRRDGRGRRDPHQSRRDDVPRRGRRPRDGQAVRRRRGEPARRRAGRPADRRGNVARRGRRAVDRRLDGRDHRRAPRPTPVRDPAGAGRAHPASCALAAVRPVRQAAAVGRRCAADARAHERRHAGGRAGGPGVRGRGHRPVPHRAHVLRRGSDHRRARDDPGRRRRAARAGALASCCRCSARTSSGSSPR